MGFVWGSEAMMRQRISPCQYSDALFFRGVRYASGREGLAMSEFGLMFTLVAFVAALALAIAWVLMPVMLAGVRSGVRDMVRQQQHANELLEALLHARRGTTASPRAEPPPRDTLLDRRYPPP